MLVSKFLPKYVNKGVKIGPFGLECIFLLQRGMAIILLATRGGSVGPVRLSRPYGISIFLLTGSNIDSRTAQPGSNIGKFLNIEVARASFAGRAPT